MTITQLRSLIRANARNLDSTYGDPTANATAVDSAIQFIAEDFILATRFPKQSTQKALVSDTNDFSITTTGFRPDRIIDVYVGDVTTNNPISCHADPLDVTDWGTVWKKRAECARTGVPEMLAFQSWDTTSDGAVWPTPTDNYILNIRWIPLFTTWTAGSADATVLAGVVNLPDDILRQIACGMAAKIQESNEDEKYWVQPATARYEAFKATQMGGGGFGNRSIQRDSIRSKRYNRRW